MSKAGRGVFLVSDTPPQPAEVIEVWISISGTAAECSCGWRSHTPAGVLPAAVMAAAEKHADGTGHYWPESETDAAEVAL